MADTSYVGPQLLPIPTGGANSALSDETLLGLLDCIGFALKADFDDKLSEMGGPKTSAAVTDACPIAHRFPWNHNGTFMRPLPNQTAEPLPALYAWEESCEVIHGTLYWEMMKRTIKVQYIFPALQIPGGYSARAGLLSSVGRSIARLSERLMRRDDYGYADAADGVPLMRPLRCEYIRMVSGQPGFLAVSPAGSAQGNYGRAGNEGHVQRFYPAYDATFRVIERIEQREPTIDDVASDELLSIGLDVDDPLEDVLQRVLIPPAEEP